MAVAYVYKMLRPLPWLESSSIVVGGSAHLDLHEIGFVGQAQVTAIEPCPEIEESDKPGVRWVTGTFVTTNAEVLDLTLEGLDEPIGTTAAHPFWSMDRGGWVAAGELECGESLRTMGGTSVVVDIDFRPGRETVYNFEVHKDHTYYVSNAQVWVHNTYTKSNSPIWKGFKPHRGKTKTNGLSGKKKRYYEWDHTHDEIEVYDSNGKHIGVIDAGTGSWLKPAVPGRKIKK